MINICERKYIFSNKLFSCLFMYHLFVNTLKFVFLIDCIYIISHNKNIIFLMVYENNAHYIDLSSDVNYNFYYYAK